MANQYDALDIAELTSIVYSANVEPQKRREAISALARRDPIERNSRVVLALQYVCKYPDRYDLEDMTSLIDILATDPQAEATAAMVEVLPEIVIPVIEETSGLARDFREYFYSAMVTRQREEDIDIWAEVLPRLKPQTLVGMVTDPAASALDVLDPIELINRLPEPNRTKALFFVLSVGTKLGTNITVLSRAAGLLRETASAPHMSQGIDVLKDQLKHARNERRHDQTEMLVNLINQIS